MKLRLRAFSRPKRRPLVGQSGRLGDVSLKAKIRGIQTRWITGSVGGGLGERGSRLRRKRAHLIRKNREQYRKLLRRVLD